MRIISGKARGLKLKAPEGLATRPTTDRIKESLFNIIAADIPESEFLDLFAGSGAIGAEALSRGADRAVFVDASPVCKDVISYNLTKAKLSDKAEIIKDDVESAIARLGDRGEKFDVIFLDPPYEGGLTEAALSAIVKHNILKPDGYIIAEVAEKYKAPNVEGLKILRVKEYKITAMVFMALEERKNA